MPRVNLWYTQGKKSQEYSKIFSLLLKKIFSTFKFIFCRYKNRRPRESSVFVLVSIIFVPDFLKFAFLKFALPE